MTSPRHSLTKVSVLVAIIASIAGCSHPKPWPGNTSTVREEIISFSDGGKLYANVTQINRAAGAKERQWQLMWERPNQPPKRLHVRGGDDLLIEWVLEVLPRSTRLASPDGTRAVVADGVMIIGSFDYNDGIAVLGDSVHPDWARELTLKHAARAAATTRRATSWPGPLDERLLMGVWVKQLGPELMGQPYDVLELNVDHTWRKARVWDRLDRPTKVEYVETGPGFELRDDERSGTSLALSKRSGERLFGVSVDCLSPDILHSGWDQYRRWRGASPIDAAPDPASAPASRPASAATTASAPDVQPAWPPALDERMLIGTWDWQPMNPLEPPEYHELLEIEGDRTWRKINVRGDPQRPTEITVQDAGQWWEVERPDLAAYRPHHVLYLYRDRAKRGLDFRVNGGEAIRKVDENALRFEPQFQTITIPREFKRWTGAAIPKEAKK